MISQGNGFFLPDLSQLVWQSLGPSMLLEWHCCSVAQLCPTICNSIDCRMPGFPVLHHLLGLAQTHVHWVGDAIQPSHPLSSPSPSVFSLSSIRVFSNESGSSHQVAKVLELQLQHHPSSEYSGLISFRINWSDLLEVQRTLKSLIQHHSSKASILWQCFQCFPIYFPWSDGSRCHDLSFLNVEL